MFKNGTHIGGIGHTEYAGSSDGDYENPACRIAINHFDVQRRLGNREEHVYGTATDRDSDDKRDHDEVSSLNPSLSGQTVTFTAFVTSPTPMPTGTVTFMDGGTILGTGTLSGGKATYGTALSSASHNFADVSAIYDGPSNIKGSNSARSIRRRVISGCEIMELSRMGRLAQLVRAPALQAGGRRFESCTAHHIFQSLADPLDPIGAFDRAPCLASV